MKILQIGVGGNGSYIIRLLTEVRAKNQFDMSKWDYTLVDFDKVEKKNLDYQLFSKEDVGKNKAEVLAKRYRAYYFKDTKILNESNLKDYDVFIIAVDNYPTRKLIAEYCYKTGKKFIDTRSFGRKVMFFSEQMRKEDYLQTLDDFDDVPGSCQLKEQREKGYIDLGNIIVADIAVQGLLNIFRGVNNSSQIVFKV